MNPLFSLFIIVTILVFCPLFPSWEGQCAAYSALPSDTAEGPNAAPMDPMGNETVHAVMGLRSATALSPGVVELVFGPAFNLQEASNNTSAFEIFSPDDPQYSFEKFVRPKKVLAEVRKDPSALSEPLPTYRVTLTLPSDMQPGCNYYIRAIGGRPRRQRPEDFRPGFEGVPVTSARNAVRLTYGMLSGETEISSETVEAVYGLRAVELVSAKHLKLTFGAAASPTSIPGDYLVTSPDDARYARGRHPEQIGRVAKPELLIPGGGWPFPRRFLMHEVYLQLPDALQEGKTYIVSVSPQVSQGRRELAFSLDVTRCVNPALKVSHVGYLPDAPVKWAYLGCWAGDLGPIDFSDVDTFDVVNSKTGEVVLSGSPELRSRPSNKQAGEYLYILDFSTLTTPGEYYIRIPEHGRSYTFPISHEAYQLPFETAMKGIFIQRCGLEMGPPHTSYRRIACHLDSPVELPWGGEAVIRGGHHDAGDYNPRSHFEVAEYLMRVYEMFPDKFRDGQLSIPERNNGIPDILDEAAWALQVFMQLQAPDGGIGVGGQHTAAIESGAPQRPADPCFVETPERDPLRQFAYPKNAKGSFIWAACAAQAARIWGQLGQEEASQEYLSRAERAYQWAMDHSPQSCPDEWAWAAAELAHTTGSTSYSADFRRSGYRFGGEDHQMRAAIAYALNDNQQADSDLQRSCRAQIIRLADDWISANQFNPYPYVKHPYAPLTWGSGAYPQRLLPVSVAYYLTREDKYLRWHIHTVELGLGANPLNLTYLTGLGQRSIHSPLHLWGWHSYQGQLMPGLQSQGPSPTDFYGFKGGWLNGLYPQPSKWPALYGYFDIKYNPAHNEGTLLNMVKTAAAYALLLP